MPALPECRGRRSGPRGSSQKSSNWVTLDARFDDLIALAQIGFSDEPKLELARNYWDEMGNGNLEDMHTRLFDGLLDDLGINGSAVDSVEWTALRHRQPPKLRYHSSRATARDPWDSRGC